MTDAPCSQRPSPAQRVATLHTIAAAVSLLERQGISAELLLAGSGVGAADLRRPSGLVTQAQVPVGALAAAVAGTPWGAAAAWPELGGRFLVWRLLREAPTPESAVVA